MGLWGTKCLTVCRITIHLNRPRGHLRALRHEVRETDDDGDDDDDGGDEDLRFTGHEAREGCVELNIH